jgi:multiple sugar transport system permease protein
MKSARSQQSKTGLLFIAPLVLCIIGVLIYPLCNSIVLSFTNKMFTYVKYDFIGWDNYIKLFQDDLFWLALFHSFKFTVFGVLGALALGLLLALLLNKNTKYIAFFRGLLFLPWTLPSIVVVLTFRWLYNDFYGYINYILLKSHIIDVPFNILSSSKTAWIGVLIPLIWCYYPFVMVFLLAALQSIDKSLYQVAELDGATKWDMFWHITLSSLKPSIIVVAILEAIWMFCSFDLVFLLTNGGPANETLTLSLYIYKMAFPAKNMAYGTALSVIMFIFLIIFTIFYFRLVGRKQNSET